MIIKRKEENELPFELNEWYTTKLATGERFLITNIKTNKECKVIGLVGLYESCMGLIDCPISPDRLIPRKIFTGNEIDVEVCNSCHKECNCKNK